MSFSCLPFPERGYGTTTMVLNYLKEALSRLRRWDVDRERALGCVDFGAWELAVRAGGSWEGLVEAKIQAGHTFGFDKNSKGAFQVMQLAPRPGETPAVLASLLCSIYKGVKVSPTLPHPEPPPLKMLTWSSNFRTGVPGFAQSSRLFTGAHSFSGQKLPLHLAGLKRWDHHPNSLSRKLTILLTFCT